MLPENLMKSGKAVRQSKPAVAKYTDADIIRASYSLVFAQLPDFQKERIKNDPHGETAQRFSKDVAAYADNPEHTAEIAAYLIQNPKKV